ncbi:MAG: N-formylglutamate amidohydrolase [Planctomycetia bacterium]|nr:N-formylglutamate amidohydrolase [Planctomycetia bacterium]
MIHLALLLLLLQPPEKDDLSKYIIISEGTMPVILSAPHGGTVDIPGVEERSGGDTVAQFTTVRDINTDLLALELADALKKKLNGTPYVVVARFSRKYIDANRPAQGAYESEKARPIYDAYHQALETACKKVKSKWGSGLLLDIHGQAVQADAIFRGTLNGKSLSLLNQRFGSAALTGKHSFQKRLEEKGYLFKPDSESNEKETRFTGGYITQHYGSHTGYGIDAIQLEMGGKYTGKANRAKTASDLADAIDHHFKHFVLQDDAGNNEKK